jgi:hypothetical protein
MKKNIYFYAITIFTVNTILFSACRERVIDVTLNKEELILEQGTTELLIATVYTNDACDKTVSWKSSNPNIATVTDNGLVIATNIGDAIITVTTKEGKKSATCSIKVVDYREKWIGDYIGEYEYSSWSMAGSYSDTEILEINVSIWQDSCLVITIDPTHPSYILKYYPKINATGDFDQHDNVGSAILSVCGGYILNNSLNFSGYISISPGGGSIYSYKGKK